MISGCRIVDDCCPCAGGMERMLMTAGEKAFCSVLIHHFFDQTSYFSDSLFAFVSNALLKKMNIAMILCGFAL